MQAAFRCDRRARLWLTGLAAMCTALAACGVGSESRTSLLLITIDTLRADRLACYGGNPETGRELCRLANEGRRFIWAFATAPSTGPSVASILTSQYPVRHGVTQIQRTQLRDSALSVAELLSEAGYQTAAFVSNPVLGRHRNLGQGFDVYDDRMTRPERNRPLMVERTAADTTDAVLAWAREAARAPLFLWVHYQDPHGP
jgi:hypothetical protein